jgi:alpha-N-arabinofuranosidase
MMKLRSSIKVKANVVFDSIDPRMYGQNIEHMGRQVLGGLVAESGSKAPQDSRGFRMDVLESIENLSPPLLRWPGGCFADSYHWSDGIGSIRPKVQNRMWGRFLAQLFFGNPPFPVGPMEDNRFGTDEFMDLCHKVGAEPSITVSLGATHPEEASGWVGYIRDTYGPQAVPTWSVGNEQWNPIEPGGCAFRPRKYVERFHRFAKAMRSANPDIKLIATGADVLLFPRWNKEIVQGIGENMDFLSMHLYMPAGIPFLSRVKDSPGDYYAITAAGLALEEQVQRIEELMDQMLGKTIPLAFDEWNILGPLRKFVVPWQTLREAIGVAGIIHTFHRQAKYIKIAAMFAMLNSASPPLLTTRDTLICTPMFYILRLYSQLSGKVRVQSEITCPTVDVPKLVNLPQRTSFPLLDVSATLDDHRLTVFVINRDYQESQEAEIEISDFTFSKPVRIHTVTANGYLAKNSENQPAVVTEKITEVDFDGHYVFPPCSVTAIVMEKTTP